MEYNAKVIARQDIAPGLIVLRISPNEGRFNFKPGQYTVLGMKKSASRVAETLQADGSDPQCFIEDDQSGEKDQMIRRAYSIASSSVQGEYLEFYLTLVSSGQLTPRLFALKVGDPVYVSMKAAGIFTLDKVSPGKDVLLVSTGTGLAPYMSMIRTYLIEGYSVLGKKHERKYVVLHGARHSWDLGYYAQLRSLARNFWNFMYFPSITRPSEDKNWHGLTGHLQNILVSEALEYELGSKVSPENFDVFLCGNPAMIESAKDMLLQRGFVPDKGKEAGTLHIEEYW